MTCYCAYRNNNGTVNTDSALITVTGAAAAATGTTAGTAAAGTAGTTATTTGTDATATTVSRTPTGRTMTAYYADGSTTTVSELSDGSWQGPGGAVYSLGSDDMLRSSGSTDLYTYNPIYG